MPLPAEWLLPQTEVPRTTPAIPLRSSSPIPLDTLLGNLTGTGRSLATTLCVFASGFVTSASPGLRFAESNPPVVGSPTAPPPSSRQEPLPRLLPPSPGNALARLRGLTGLNLSQLATLFGVTRPTLHAWQRGSLPRGERETHLLGALSFAENAAGQFETAQAFRQWLLTPVVPGAESPFQLMAQSRWRPLRGLLVQARTLSRPLPTPEPLRGTAPPLAPTEWRRALRQLSPPPAREDLEPFETEPGEPDSDL